MKFNRQKTLKLLAALGLITALQLTIPMTTSVAQNNYYGNYGTSKSGKPQVDIYENGSMLGMFIVDRVDDRGRAVEVTIQLPNGARPLLTDQPSLNLGTRVKIAVDNGTEDDNLTAKIYQKVKETKRAREAKR